MNEIPIPTDDECDIYIRNKVDELIALNPDINFKKYFETYAVIPIPGLQKLFSFLHYQINYLFEFLNDKKYNNHYNAEESRKLISIIKLIEDINLNIKGTKYEFKIIDYYANILKKCKQFLKKTGGSPIPEDFDEIKLIEVNAIFSLNKSIKINNKNHSLNLELKHIGKGSYATVSKFKDTNYDITFALKKANKDLNEKEIERFKKEFSEMKKFNSPYILSVYSYDPENMHYIMEYADETIHDFITINNNKLQIEVRINLINQIFKAFEYLSNKSVLHRDISTTNILIKKYEDSLVVKVSDFGLVKTKESNLTSSNTELKGTLNDPKLEFIGFENYNIIHETYALTRLIYFILTGKTKYKELNQNKTDEFIKKGLGDENNRFKTIKEMAQLFKICKSELMSIKS